MTGLMKLWSDFAGSYDTEKILPTYEPKSLGGALVGVFLLVVVPGYIPPLARHGNIHAQWQVFGVFVAAVSCSYLFYRRRGKPPWGPVLTAADTLLSQTALTLAVVTTTGHVRWAYAVLQGLVVVALVSRYYALTWVYASILAIPLVGVVALALTLAAVDPETLLVSLCVYLFSLWVSYFTRMERAAARKSSELREAVVASDTVATQSLELALTRTALTVGDTLHELRNHLGVVGAGLEFLSESPDDDPDRREALADSLSSYQTARKVLEDSISKLKRSKDQLAIPFNAIRPLQELAGEQAPAGLQLQAQGDTESFLVRGEEDGLRIVLTNLTRNAAKAGATNMRVAWRLETAGKALRIELSDDGPGISPDIADDLFKPFASKTKGGTGLGLYLSRRQIELMGGTISVASKPGKGACFTIVLPGRVARASTHSVDR